MSQVETPSENIVRNFRPSSEQIKSYKAEGFTIIPGLLSQEHAMTLNQEVVQMMELIGLPVSKLKQTHEYLAGGTIDKLVNSPRLLAVAEALMEGPGTLYLPFTAVKSPGGGRFHFHQDNQYTRFDGPGINLWIALTKMTLENGCLQVIPRSHLAGTLESEQSGDGDVHRKIKWEPGDFKPVCMDPGDCIAFSRLTIHGSGTNSTAQSRIAYAIQFHRDDVHAYWDGQTRLLKEHPRWNTAPVQKMTIPKEKVDGH